MLNRDAVMTCILTCLKNIADSGVEITPDSDLINDLGLESVRVLDLLMMLEDKLDISIPINILLDVRTPRQLLNALQPWLENANGSL
ncbi:MULTISPECIES: acyl carrier protein [Tatumella]|uniref:Acyl carrier protein n=1 Tax=Tatumella punctata TaxID=399969 RepID=A0ABW1VSX7_9GAMM|nr:MULTISPECIES: acyl carrier protein [unclassified Tatumella]MBS0856043.1 acyl carrier protein [Tatumella sp. JGM16]MBS0878102.1 acyl carrier protein [Tatumella sp. JGM82]MBS0890461.1 acyl carrier protein [Tatumella sp. JGM94]MBS0895153.1 acyl carrier protein [Tatumella sp. JGM130]MBS0900917.1 acyl carrier protein [Tatumella sp. JGM100]